jgi:phosphatidate phosphatase APP1
VEASAGPASGEGALLLLPPDNRRGLISDLDDTILVTGVNDKARMLGNTFLKNPAQREAVPAMAWLYKTVLASNPAPRAAPLFYLSASPRQLHGAIATFLKLNGFPDGVLITKRVTDDRTSEPLLDQMAYKLQKIEDILARTPGVHFVLVGDDGERDPDIYETVRRQHTERVEAIWIRRVNPQPVRLPAGQLTLSEVLRQVGLRSEN